MSQRAVRAAVVTALAYFFVACPAPASACPVGRGARVLLVSQELDPDVFLWDSADRLVRYAAGDYDTESVLKHTTLVKAFSRAVATGCKNDSVQVSSPGTTGGAVVFLIGVRIVSGNARGHYGWVLSSDIRGPDGRALTPQRRHGGAASR